MIVFDLACANGHRFEGWFASSADYDGQQARGLVTCPQCACDEVAKAPMAPAVPSKGNRAVAAAPGDAPAAQLASGPMPPEVAKAFKALAEAQAKALTTSTWVGDRFADEVRSMHYGERDEAQVHGRATREQAEGLHAEGILVAPILFPVVPPEERN